ncbi:hypothetical protein E2C01_049398 [Portunus trituberculatus]|uniref:Uncharacterized protein n=1 Tax=Portunus trituberculatus TaxID=210409 RepID=A0A5B7GDV3_PORTR|nr:hypothetical protein [Portunus trituberculatus]
MYASMPDTITSVMRSAQRWVSDMEAEIIPGKISIIPPPPQVPPAGTGKNGKGTVTLGDPVEGLEK